MIKPLSVVQELMGVFASDLQSGQKIEVGDFPSGPMAESSLLR